MMSRSVISRAGGKSTFVSRRMGDCQVVLRKRKSIRRANFGNDSIYRSIGCVLFLILFSSCATTALPTTREIGEVLGGQKTVILLRITVDVDGKSSEPFSRSLVDDNVGLAWVSGDSVKLIDYYRSPSDESRRDGWIYIIEDPGTYYLAVQPPRRVDSFSYFFGFRSAPRWRIDALAGSRVVYVGRLRINAFTRSGFLFSTHTYYDLSKTTVQDERNLARDLAAKFFSELGSPVTAVMEPVGMPARNPE